jgi:hypothetical protein
MPAPKPEEHLAHLEKLSEEYRIDFAGELHPSAWPECHKATLANAGKLGDKKYDSYATSSNESENAPWKLKVKDTAAILVETAGRCRHRNESSWRYACEPIILAKLSSEVCW